MLDDPDLDHLERVRRARLADARARRPGGLRRRPVLRRGPRARPRARCSRELVAEHEAKGTLHRGDGPVRRAGAAAVDAALPGQGGARSPTATSWSPTRGTTAWPSSRPDGETARAPDRQRRGAGSLDGDRRRRALQRAQRAVPAARPRSRPSVGYDVVVADTVNHALRGVDLADGDGHHGRRHRRSSGCRATPRPPESPARERRRCPRRGTSPGRPTRTRSSVAMAGIHQLWPFDPVDAPSPSVRGHHERGAARRPASTRPGSRSRPAWRSRTDGDGERLWFADSETSSLRSLRAGVVDDPRRRRGSSTSAIATGRPSEAMLQHPLGVTLLPDGSRRGPATRTTTRYAATTRSTARSRPWPRPARAVRRCARPRHRTGTRPARGRVGGAPADPAPAAGRGGAGRRARPTAPSARHSTSPPATFELVVVFEPPAGQKLDDRYGPSTRLLVSASPPELLRRR